MKKIILLTAIITLTFAYEDSNKNNQHKHYEENYYFDTYNHEDFRNFNYEKYNKRNQIHYTSNQKYKYTYHIEYLNTYDKIRLETDIVNVFFPKNHVIEYMKQTEIEYQFCNDSDNSYLMFDKNMKFQLFVKDDSEDSLKEDYNYLITINKEDCFKFLY